MLRLFGARRRLVCLEAIEDGNRWPSSHALIRAIVCLEAIEDGNPLHPQAAFAAPQLFASKL